MCAKLYLVGSWLLPGLSLAFCLILLQTWFNQTIFGAVQVAHDGMQIVQLGEFGEDGFFVVLEALASPCV